MSYTDWDLLSITLYQNSVNINKSLTMRSDIEKMDTSMVSNLLMDVLISMTSETLRSNFNSILPPNCNNWDFLEMSLFLNETLFKTILIQRTEFSNNLSDSYDFFYNKFITLSEISLLEPQAIESGTTENNQVTSGQTGINGTFTTVDGFTITVEGGLIISIN